MSEDKGLAWDVMLKSYRRWKAFGLITAPELDMLMGLYDQFVDQGIENHTDLHFDWGTITKRWEDGQKPMWEEVQDTVYFSLTIPSVKSDKTLDLINLARDIGVPFNVSYGDPINYEELD